MVTYLPYLLIHTTKNMTKIIFKIAKLKKKSKVKVEKCRYKKSYEKSNKTNVVSKNKKKRKFFKS